MFSFKKDKTGFFSAVSLIILAAATVIVTGILLAQGIKENNWEYYSVPIKIVLAVFWITGMTIVLTRIGVFAVQRGNTLATNFALRVAIPERRCMKLRMIRSADKIPRIGP